MSDPIFSAYKCIMFLMTNPNFKHESETTLFLIHADWMFKCLNKTEKEMKEMGFITRPEFMRLKEEK